MNANNFKKSNHKDNILYLISQEIQIIFLNIIFQNIFSNKAFVFF